MPDFCERRISDHLQQARYFGKYVGQDDMLVILIDYVFDEIKIRSCIVISKSLVLGNIAGISFSYYK